MLLVANLPIQNDAKKRKMTKSLANGYLPENAPPELSNEYQYDMV